MDNVLIVLERDNEEHNLKFGEYFYNASENTLYIGIGDIGEGNPGAIGTIVITENGEYDIEFFKTAVVDVYGKKPTETLKIFKNGLYDVVDKAMVDVNVQGEKNAIRLTVSGIQPYMLNLRCKLKTRLMLDNISA